jgi:hypothetical protein
MRVRILLLLGAGLALTVGCGGGKGPKLAPVSGQVKVDGKPYPNAYVTYQPRATKDNPDPGRGSVGITDADGRFTLMYEGGKPGAVVGKHIIRITSVQPADDPSRFKDTEETGSPDGIVRDPAAGKFRPEIIPPDWNTESQREVEVPPGGTDKANFEIWSKKR